jgi:hypothetical protein
VPVLVPSCKGSSAPGGKRWRVTSGQPRTSASIAPSFSAPTPPPPLPVLFVFSLYRIVCFLSLSAFPVSVSLCLFCLHCLCLSSLSFLFRFSSSQLAVLRPRHVLRRSLSYSIHCCLRSHPGFALHLFARGVSYCRASYRPSAKSKLCTCWQRWHYRATADLVWTWWWPDIDGAKNHCRYR